MATAEEAELRRLMDKAGEAIINPLREPIREIYIDTDLLYDYRLGALLLKLKNEDEFSYVREHLHSYEEGPLPTITSYFPDLKITEEELDLLEDDLAFEKFLHATAPGTQFLMDLPNLIVRINTFNSNKLDPPPLTVHLNQRKHIMPKMIRERLLGAIRAQDSSANIKFENFETWNDIPEDMFKRCRMLFVYDLIDFCRLGTVPAKFMHSMKVNDKTLVANFMTEGGFPDEKTHLDAINKFCAVMSALFGNFQFMKKAVLIER